MESGVRSIDFPHFGQSPVVPIFSAVTFSLAPHEQVKEGDAFQFTPGENTGYTLHTEK